MVQLRGIQVAAEWLSELLVDEGEMSQVPVGDAAIDFFERTPLGRPLVAENS